MSGAVLAAAKGYTYCTGSGIPSGSNSTATLDNGGLNSVVVYGCNASNPSPSTCAIGSDTVYPCGIIIGANSSLGIEVLSAATALVVQYFVPQPFNWHAISSTPPGILAWPPATSLRPQSQAPPPPVIPIPYPAPGVQLCDSNTDCPPGVACLQGSPSRVCANTPPVAPTPDPAPLPAPTPPPAPVAASCSLEGSWKQYVSWAYSIESVWNFSAPGSGGSFAWMCNTTGTDGSNQCPFNTTMLSGTGALSASDATLTLTPAQAGLGSLYGVLNDTYSCAFAMLQSAPVGAWKPLIYLSKLTPRPQGDLNLDITQGTYLAPNTGEGDSFVGTGVSVLSSTLVAVCGNGQASYAGITPTAIIGASPTANGTILLMKVDTTAPRGSGGSVVAVVKVGERIDHMRANSAGSVVVVGSFGVAVLTALQGNGQTPAVLWHDPLTTLEPGSCGVCCSVSGNNIVTCKADIGADGTVGVNLAVSSAEGFLWALWNSTGTRIAEGAEGGAALTSIAVDAANSRVLVGWFYNSNTGKEPMVMPRVNYYRYDPAGVYSRAVSSPTEGTQVHHDASTIEGAQGSVVLDFANFPWSAAVYRGEGQPCYGDVADGRVMGLRIGQDGALVWMGRSDGGDSPFYCGLRDSTRLTPFASVDEFNVCPNHEAAQALSNLMRVNASTGEVIVGQLSVAILPSSGRGNSLLTLAGTTDEAGTLYLLQNAGCCLPFMTNLTVNGRPLAGNVDASALAILPPTMASRHHWTFFATSSSSAQLEAESVERAHADTSPLTGPVPWGGAPSGAVDIDVRGGTVALLLNSNGPMVSAGALPGTGYSPSGQPAAYLVVLPAV